MFDPAVIPHNTKTTTWLEVTARADGGDWRLPLLVVRGQQDGPTLAVLAGVHGDEYEGVEVIPQVFRQVDPAALSGTLLMVPVCNLPAYGAAQRSSPVDGLNLARVFPGRVDGTLTERIAYVLVESVFRHADFVIDLHSGGIPYELPTLVGYVHDAGELGQRALAGARAFGADVLWGHPLPMPPGRSLSIATELGIPELYTEAAGGGYARPADVTLFTQGVLNVARHLGMLAGAVAVPAPTHHLVGDGNLDVVIDAPAAGFFRAEVALLQEVRAGQRLGAIRDLFGVEIAAVTAPAAGVVILLRRMHRVNLGDGLVQVTQRLA